MKHIMLDLETLSTEPNAMITAIGAVVMDFETCTIGETFERQVDIGSYKPGCGFDMSASTVKWWLSQANEVQQHMLENTVHWEDAIREFIEWSCRLVEHGFENIPIYDLDSLIVWGNGSTFDNLIIRNAISKFGKNYLWSYRNDRCYRTIKNIFPKLDFKVDGLTAHRSLDDAKYQALYLLELHKHVGLNLP